MEGYRGLLRWHRLGLWALTAMATHSKIVHCSDIDPLAHRVHKALHKVPVSHADICKRDHARLPDADIYIASPPCQPFSPAGKRLGFLDPRTEPFQALLDTISTRLPRVFILENVPGLRSTRKGKDF